MVVVVEERFEDWKSMEALVQKRNGLQHAAFHGETRTNPNEQTVVFTLASGAGSRFDGGFADVIQDEQHTGTGQIAIVAKNLTTGS